MSIFRVPKQGHSEGTNNQLANIFYSSLIQLYFIHLIHSSSTLNIKLFIFKLFDVKFLFAENNVFRKQKRAAVYGVMDARPLFRILNSLGENDDLLSSRHK